MNRNNLSCWFDETLLGHYVQQQEESFFNHSASRYAFGTTVQMGMPEWALLGGHQVIRCEYDFKMRAEYSAWMTGSLDLLLMPHVLEFCDAYTLALAEAYRALKPEGRLVLTGLNPHSILRFSRCFNKKYYPLKNKCIPLPRLKKSVHNLGFSIESGRFMAYRPMVQNKSALHLLGFMEAAGDRWWPHAAAVYGLVLTKRQAGVHLLTQTEQNQSTEEIMALTPARVKCG
ncbi:MAG: methyltransferase domain-containing protein [Neisseria sp.]|uniref:class I SAM-dependent methyltransferase n=1 Tax=Neisseria sp. TaxID=192066 RepID=UPI0026DB2FDD|nr:methyltransferase domain-containing protein [Neisseria sp.]MDO4641200.1 methyltransferase domain-containing protein [Neisseria sp.]